MSMKNDTEPTIIAGLTRRAFVAGAGAGLLASSVGTALAGSHEGHGDHSGHAHGHNPSLVKTALDCVASGNACIEHCIVQLKAGDTSMAECAAAVEEMTAVCTGLARLAALDSKHLRAYAAACIAICKDCEAACREHEKMHAICKACAESCKACIAECEKLPA